MPLQGLHFWAFPAAFSSLVDTKIKGTDTLHIPKQRPFLGIRYMRTASAFPNSVAQK